MYLSGLKITRPIRGFEKLDLRGLGSIVLLAGKNGSGKSRLLKLLMEYQKAQTKYHCGEYLCDEEKKILNSVYPELMGEDGRKIELEEYTKINFLNYSQYDEPLQLPDRFPTYVISQARENLTKCDFEESARDALLYLKYLVKHYKYDSISGGENDLEALNGLLEVLLGQRLTSLNGEPSLFGLPLNGMQLSPGQQYLLRMCVALHCNKVIGNSILLLDEPETHLHPDALLNLIRELHTRFKLKQIWIATHSVALLSKFNASDIWHMTERTAKRLGSKSGPLMESLLGEESQRAQLQEFIGAPVAFACNEFAYECLWEPPTEPYKRNDPQVAVTLEAVLADSSAQRAVVVDFGVGQGRFLDGVGMDHPERLPQLDYYAYDKYDTDKKICQAVMIKHNVDKARYFNDIKALETELKGKGKATHVLLVNVLHEIPPEKWPESFATIMSLLREGGKLILVEAEELRFGEKPYMEGFLVVQESAVKLLLKGAEVQCDHCEPPYERVVRYQIPKELLCNIDSTSVNAAVEEIGRISLDKIYKLRKDSNQNKQWLSGVQLAFWTHQYANVQLFRHLHSEESTK